MPRHILLIVGILSIYLTPVSAQNKKQIDSLHDRLITEQKDTTIINLHYQLATAFINQPDSSLYYLKKGLELSKSHGYTGLEHQGMNLLTKHLYIQGQLDSATQVVREALQIKSDNNLEILKSNNLQGNLLYTMGQNEPAMQFYIKTLEMAEKIKDTLHIMLVTGNIGNVHYYLGNHGKALENFQIALDLSRNLGLKEQIAPNLGSMGLVYSELGQSEKALEFYRQGLQIYKEVGDDFGTSITLLNIGELYEDLERFQEAKRDLLEANMISRKIQDDVSVALTYTGIGVVEAKTKNFQRGLQYVDSAIAIAKKINYNEGLRSAYLAQSEIYPDMGDYQAAFDSRKQYEKWNDSLINERHLEAIGELEIKYETEKKEKDILALSEQKLKDDAVLEAQKSRIRMLSLGLLGTLLLFGSVFVIFRQRSRNQKQKELITAISDTQIAERKRIAQDLHDSVGGSLALAKNKLSTLFENGGPNSKEIKESMETLSQAGEQVRQISHNLMPGELVKFGLVSAVQSTLDQLAETSLETHLYTHDMEKRIDPAKEVHLYRLIQEIVQNVIKHAQAKTLNVHLNKHKKHLSLMVEDDGIGMEGEASMKNGMGLSNIRARVDYLKGTCNLDSNKGRGTTVTIQVPL